MKSVNRNRPWVAQMGWTEFLAYDLGRCYTQALVAGMDYRHHRTPAARGSYRRAVRAARHARDIYLEARNLARVPIEPMAREDSLDRIIHQGEAA